MNLIFSRIQDKSLFVQAIFIFIITFPFIFSYNNLVHIILESYFNIKIQNQIGEQSLAFSLLTSVVIAPFIETIIFQSFTVPAIYFLIGKFHLKFSEQIIKQILCILSSIVFALSHSLNHPYYPLIIFPFCYVLNFVFVAKYFSEGRFRAFQLTWLIHIFWNLTILVGFYTSEYF
jgi:hypothetical protein